MLNEPLIGDMPLDRLLKEKQKQAEKAMIQSAIAMSALSKANNQTKKLKTSTDTTMNVTKQSVNKVTTDMSSSLKGAWGKKAKESFKANSEKIDSI